MKTISGYEALKRMRAMRHDEGSFFIMHHLTWNEIRKQTDGMRIVRRCRLRQSLPHESMKPHPDLLQPYTDLNLPKKDRNRMCRKRLIRYVAFSPEYELLKVDWLNLEKDGAIQVLNE